MLNNTGRLDLHQHLGIKMIANYPQRISTSQSTILNYTIKRLDFTRTSFTGLGFMGLSITQYSDSKM